MITPEDIRRELEAELGHPLRDKVWDDLVEGRWVHEVEDGEADVAALARHVRHVVGVYGDPYASRADTPRTLPRSNGEPGARLSGGREEVISHLLAAEAMNDEGVQAFRISVLENSLLTRDEVETWIERQAQADGPPSAWLSVPVPPEYNLKASEKGATTEPPLTISNERPAVLVQRRYLSYLSHRESPDSDPRREVPTADAGALERLRQLSEALALRYGWDQALATNFVLTGEIPLAPLIETRSSVPHPLTALARISLTIDPALSPREVADHYRRIRGEIVGARHRDQSEKHMRLATFTAARPAGETLRKRMAAWNKEYPEWRYKEKRNFDRDCKKAIQRLLHPDYGPKIEF